MARIIKISFQDHPIEAKNSNPTTDIITLILDFFGIDFGEKIAAITLKGTQNVINAINDQNPLEINGQNGVTNHATVLGNVEVTANFENDTELYTTYGITATLIDHVGWQSIQKTERPTNLILTHNHEAILTENGDALVFVQPQNPLP